MAKSMQYGSMGGGGPPPALPPGSATRANQILMRDDERGSKWDSLQTLTKRTHERPVGHHIVKGITYTKLGSGCLILVGENLVWDSEKKLQSPFMCVNKIYPPLSGIYPFPMLVATGSFSPKLKSHNSADWFHWFYHFHWLKKEEFIFLSFYF